MSATAIDETLSDQCFRELLQITHDLTGITIGETRRSMLVTRLRRRIREHGLRDFESYVGLLKTDKSEVEHFVNSVTTNETYFYRTPRVWSYLRETILPAWRANHPGRPFRAWSAAASTGEEAHTLGILLENEKCQSTGFTYSILGTDISQRVIAKAKDGRYVGRPVERFRRSEPELFDRFMQGSEESGFTAVPAIKSALEFKTHNLFRPLTGAGKFDVVFLRNVLIYFTRQDQEKVLDNIHRVLHPEGVLVIGESETLAPLSTPFEPVAPFTYCSIKGADGKVA